MQELGLDIGHLDVGCSLYDFCYDINTHQWTPWGDTVPLFVVPKGASYENIVVPTLDSIRLAHSITTLLLNGHSVICPGPTGTGKTVNLTDLLLLTLPDTYETHLMTFSAHTRVNQVQVRVHSAASTPHCYATKFLWRRQPIPGHFPPFAPLNKTQFRGSAPPTYLDCTS